MVTAKLILTSRLLGYEWACISVCSKRMTNATGDYWWLYRTLLLLLLMTIFDDEDEDDDDDDDVDRRWRVNCVRYWLAKTGTKWCLTQSDLRVESMETAWSSVSTSLFSFSSATVSIFYSCLCCNDKQSCFSLFFRSYLWVQMWKNYYKRSVFAKIFKISRVKVNVGVPADKRNL